MDIRPFIPESSGSQPTHQRHHIPRNRSLSSTRVKLPFFIDKKEVIFEAGKQLASKSTQERADWVNKQPHKRSGLMSFLTKESALNRREMVSASACQLYAPYRAGLLSCAAIGGLKAAARYDDALTNEALYASIHKRFHAGIQCLMPNIYKTVTDSELGGAMMGFIAAARVDQNLLARYTKQDDQDFYKKMLLPAVCVFISTPENESFATSQQAFGAVSQFFTTPQSASALEIYCWRTYNALTLGKNEKSATMMAQAQAKRDLLNQQEAPIVDDSQPAASSSKRKRGGKYYFYVSVSPEPEQTSQPPKQKKARTLSNSKSPKTQAKKSSEPFATQNALLAAPKKVLNDESKRDATNLFEVEGFEASALLTRDQIFYLCLPPHQWHEHDRDKEEFIEFFGATVSLERSSIREFLGVKP